MSDTSVIAFLGDRDRRFDLLPHLGELERVVGAGTGAIVKRVVQADFHAVDIPTIVRLALIGGGETPKEASALVTAYITGRPLSEGHELATAILMAVWSGKPKPAPAPALTAEAGEIILDATGRNPVRVENDGSLTPLNPSAPPPAWLDAMPDASVNAAGAA